MRGERRPSPRRASVGCHGLESIGRTSPPGCRGIASGPGTRPRLSCSSAWPAGAVTIPPASASRTTMDNMSRRGYDPLTYRFEDQAPAPGRVTLVADGVYWVRMPMGGRLNHINVWLLRDRDGWTIVDTGLFRDNVKDHWREIFAAQLDAKPITRVVATHLHNGPYRPGRLDYRRMELRAVDEPRGLLHVQSDGLGRPVRCASRCYRLLSPGRVYRRPTGPLPRTLRPIRREYRAASGRVPADQRRAVHRYRRAGVARGSLDMAMPRSTFACIARS